MNDDFPDTDTKSFDSKTDSYFNVFSSRDNIIDERKSKSPINETVPYHKLFRFTNSIDKLIVFLMVTSSIALGIAFPCNILIFKSVVNIITKPDVNIKYQIELKTLIHEFAILASSALISGFVQMICISLMASRQNLHYKSAYFSALLRQEISWFDKQQTGQMITTLTDNIECIEVAISEKLAQFIQQITVFIASIVIATYSGWKLTLVGCTSIPLMCIVFILMIRFITKFTTKQVREYSIAGGIAEEILSGIRTVVAFNAQSKDLERYKMNLKNAQELGIKISICQGLGSGFICFFVFSVGSLVFYNGINFINDNSYEAGVVVQVFLTIVLGSISLGNAAPIIENFMSATAAAFPIFEVLDSRPIIDHEIKGIIPQTFIGDITFKNVTFEYPTRKKHVILKDFNFTIPHGKTVAFVGPSGSGKSTIIHLLQRFYDPVFGKITLNDQNLQTIDLNWYRSHIGVVQQEPPLFSGTIKENIKFGKMTAVDEEIIQASKNSNAYEFINKIDTKFDTLIGEQGIGFSGGQKQRISIATALVRDPKLLLLDEATSALDSKSEKQIQATLDTTISTGRKTVVMVAHRLQTVRNADIIVVMRYGKIEEQGTHSELVSREGLYWNMLQQQKNEDGDCCGTSNEIETNTDIRESLLHNNTAEPDVPQEVYKYQEFKAFYRLLHLNRNEKYILLFGIIASMVIGVTFPVSSLIYSEMFKVFKLKFEDPDKMLKEGYFYSALMLVPGSVLLVSQLVKNFCLGKSGEVLTATLRSLMMESILKQEISWFDQPENLSGVLTARLASEASLVKGSAGIQLSIYIEAITNLVVALFIGFFNSWQLSLLFLAFYPFITLSGVMQGKLSSGQRLSNYAAVSSSSLVLEVLNNIRIVHSLGLQNHFSVKYRESLQFTGQRRKLLLYGFVSGVGCSAMYYAYCLIFYVGGILMDNKTIKMDNLMRVFLCFIMSSAALGQALALAPDTEKAKKATQKTLGTIDRKPLIATTGNLVPDVPLSGKIEFKNIYFHYPTRPNVPVLKNFNLVIKPGESVALVGHSGCGKSTIIQLLERYYDPVVRNIERPPKILLDGYDLKDLNLAWVRNQLGLVKQEPTLFNLTILQNIVYGSNETVNMERVLVVSRLANILDFIEKLPGGFQYSAGQRGGHLSGGEKQRICIARALYNKPAILLLDEATSALDNNSESIVQDAIDQAQKTSTSITIAHKLSTIRNANNIVVIENGNVIETGNHTELMGKKGFYFEMINSSTS